MYLCNITGTALAIHPTNCKTNLSNIQLFFPLFQITSKMRPNGHVAAGERAEPEQLGGVQLAHRGELLPAPRRAATAHEAAGAGVQRRAAATFR